MKKKGKIMKLSIILGSILLICTLLIGIFPLGIQTVSATHLAESYHPYANNYEHTWTISEPGAAEIRIHFTKIELASYDYISIPDKDNQPLTSYGSGRGTTTYEDKWTEWYTGDTLKVKLKTSNEGTAFGFIVDKIETRGTVPTSESTSSLAESYHPYANNYEHTWTISEPGAAEIRIHFTKIELAIADYISILGKNNQQLTSYSGYRGTSTYEDKWTEWYTGDTLKVKLVTNFKDTAFGFIVDKVETRGTVPTPEPTSSPSQTPTIIPTPEISSPTPGEPYVHLYGHKTNVIVGEEVILYLSVVNPITSPGTLKVQLTLQVPSGWSITSSEFSSPAGGVQTAVYEIEQGPDTETIGIHMLANQPFDGVITGYTDYYFIEEPESKYHGEINEPVTAQQEKPLPSSTPAPGETPAPTPGFEAILAIGAIAIIVLLLRRK